jgi:hypothetical protein
MAKDIRFNIYEPALSKAKSRKERNIEICFTYLVSREIIAFLRHTA